MDERARLEGELVNKNVLYDHVSKGLRELQVEVNGLKHQLARLDAKGGKLKVGDTFWFISSAGDIIKSTWENCADDIALWELGNVYPSYQAAEDAMRRQQIRARLQRLADASGGDSECDWYQIRLLDGAIAAHGWARQYRIGVPRFATRESADAAIEDIGEDDLRFLLEGE